MKGKLLLVVLLIAFQLENGSTEDIHDFESALETFFNENEGSGSGATTDSPTSQPPQLPKSCKEENVGIKIQGIKTKEFNDVNNDQAHHRVKLQGALAKGITRYCNSLGKECPNGAGSIEANDIKYSTNVTESNNNLFVDFCVARKSRFGNSNSLFKRSKLIEVIKSAEAQEVIRQEYKPSISVETAPKKSTGLKGWQIALIVVGRDMS
ncbi:DgyrCDS12796 [Dimorphilus gyrociliatus]|uniref:DgyrCDS12796 n=1 Tax=Dimorphilus gyrociliatus TaxID=2664684 RepID=A0A7I8W8S6_9ANNE|nr:DgyrCDS12796 [Dimorphilus gyrociliatus]